MAQLRDAKTSELLAEGTPLEVVHAAKAAGLRAGVLGTDQDPGELEAIYDDVGLGFDPDAVHDQHARELEALETAAAEARKLKGKQRSPEDIKAIEERARDLEARAETGAKMAGDATKRLEKARRRAKV